MANGTLEMMPISEAELSAVCESIAGDATNKNLLSMGQLDVADIYGYIAEAEAARELLDNWPSGARLLPYQQVAVVMQQPSTRTGGSMTRAMWKLGGNAALYSGMQASSESKGESPADTWVAFATQADIIGTRTPQVYGPAYAAHAIAQSQRYGKIRRSVPVINLGDGSNEHPTQALGDLLTIYDRFGSFDGLTLAVVGDHERYRAFHSLFIGAAACNMRVVAVESPAAPVPERYRELLDARLQVTDDLDGAMKAADVLYMGRNPDEYTGNDAAEEDRSQKLAHSYASWVVDAGRLQQMSTDAILLHPRPRRNELDPSVDPDPRAQDVPQMENMIPMRMAIIARHLGVSIVEHLRGSHR